MVGLGPLARPVVCCWSWVAAVLAALVAVPVLMPSAVRRVMVRAANGKPARVL